MMPTKQIFENRSSQLSCRCWMNNGPLCKECKEKMRLADDAEAKTNAEVHIKCRDVLRIFNELGSSLVDDVAGSDAKLWELCDNIESGKWDRVRKAWPKLKPRLKRYATLQRKQSTIPGHYVNLAQAAALVNRTKRTLEKAEGLPEPDIRGGGGKPNEWLWAKLRPWLEKKFGRELPEVFPSHNLNARA